MPLRQEQAEARRREDARIAAEKAAMAAQEAAQARVRVRAEQSAAAEAATRQTASRRVTAGVSGSHADWMASAGIAPSDYGYVEYIVGRESGWRYWIVNSEGSGATGLCQALPESKMASAGPDYLTNPVTQLRWCSSYAVSRYGSWAGAYAAWQRQNWW